MNFVGKGLRLSAGDIEQEAKTIGCKPAAVHAVCDVESGGGGFLTSNKPKILFEAHEFYKETRGRFGDSNISSSYWNRNLYGAGGEYQYERLERALELDKDAALKSTSWGMFQIMGMNYGSLGFDNIDIFVSSMMESEVWHLEAFVRFCFKNKIAGCLREPVDFDSFTRIYNGPGQVEFYSNKLQASYEKWDENEIMTPGYNPISRADLPFDFHSRTSVMLVQNKLIGLGYELVADGVPGIKTQRAVVDFQVKHNLVPDGYVGPLTRKALGL